MLTRPTTSPVTPTQVRCIVHRGTGQHSDIRENSLQALTHGLRVADGVETDLRLSRSGSIWINHDPHVFDEVTGKKVFIHRATDAELLKVRAKGGDGQLYPLTTLEALLEVLAKPELKGKIGILETKMAPAGLNRAEKRSYERTITREQNRLIAKYDVRDQVRQSSFDPAMLKGIRDSAPESQTRLLTAPHAPFAPQVLRARLKGATFDGIHAGTNHGKGENFSVGPAQLSRLNGRYSAMGSWSTNDPTEAAAQVAAALASDRLREFELITDHPEIISDVVHRRNGNET